MAPNSQPFITHAAGPARDFRSGSCQIALTTRVRATLKSDSPRLSLKSNQCKLGMELEKASPTIVVEPVSILLPQVKDPWSCKPWLILLVSCASKASKKELPLHRSPLMEPKFGLMVVPLPTGEGQR